MLVIVKNNINVLISAIHIGTVTTTLGCHFNLAGLLCISISPYHHGDQPINVIIPKRQINSLWLEIVYASYASIWKSKTIFESRWSYTFTSTAKKNLPKEAAELWKICWHYLTYIVSYGEQWCRMQEKNKSLGAGKIPWMSTEILGHIQSIT